MGAKGTHFLTEISGKRGKEQSRAQLIWYLFS